MSPKNKVLLIALLTVAAAGWVLLAGGLSGQRGLSSSSTYSSGPAGCKALYLLLQEIQLQVSRFRKPFSRLDRDQGVLLITNPDQVPFTSREITKLKNWIRRGNRLVIFFGRTKAIFGGQEGESSHGEGAAAKTDPIQRFSDNFGLSLKRFSDNSRKIFNTSLPGLDEPARISMSSAFRWKRPLGAWKEILGDKSGALVVTRKLGSGDIVAVSDATFPSNAELAHDQNLKWTLALLLEKDKSNHLLFDEYHHGYGIEESLWSYLGSSVFVFVLLQAVVGSALFFYSKRASYSGRFKSLGAPKGRSSLEYVDSMANIFKSCGAGSAALEAILARFLAQLSRRTGIPLKTLAPESLNGAVMSATEEKEDVAGLIRECRSVASSEAKPIEALALARKLAAVRTAMEPVPRVMLKRYSLRH